MYCVTNQSSFKEQYCNKIPQIYILNTLFKNLHCMLYGHCEIWGRIFQNVSF